jgi:acetoin utilization protein AcuB
MIVGMWMTRDLVCVQPDTPIGEAARLMADNGIRRLPVVTVGKEEPELLGILSATDIYKAYPAHCNPFTAEVPAAAESTTAGQIMSRNLLVTSPDAPIEDAAATMRDRKVGALPVLREGRLVGLITESDIFRAFVSILKADAGATRVTFAVEKDEDLFLLLANEVRTQRIQLFSMMVSRKDGQSVCVVRIAGDGVQEFIDDLWKSGHQVVNVLQMT